jgi:hypothetical protein
MKKIFLIFGLIVIFYTVTSIPLVLAQTRVTPTPTDEKTETQEMDSEEKAAERARIAEGYHLPYPGILPDNPLHFLKAIRDRITLFLITDPVRETEFNILTSDKRIYAALMLAERGKDGLSISTLSKSNNYFHNALSSVGDAKRRGKNVDTVLHNMKRSIIKHQQVLGMIEREVSKDFSDQLQAEEKRMIEFEKSVDNLLLR